MKACQVLGGGQKLTGSTLMARAGRQSSLTMDELNSGDACGRPDFCEASEAYSYSIVKFTTRIAYSTVNLMRRATCSTINLTRHVTVL